MERKMIIPPGPPIPTQPQADARETAMRRKAQELEATFLAEMLAHAGLTESEGAMSGGVGEAQFASFLRRERATTIAGHGGLGLAESIFEAMKRAEDHGN
jgi:Rod binding domain-containing protein